MTKTKNKRSTDIYMSIPWHDYVTSGKEVTIRNASLSEKASVIGRVGISLLACGSTAWFVRGSMSSVSRALGVTCVADIGIVSINFTCYEGHESYSQSISLDGVGVDSDNLNSMEQFVRTFEKNYLQKNADEIHDVLDEIQFKRQNYSTLFSALIAGIACCCMVFICGGGPAEMVCVFIAAGIGNLIRTLLNQKRFSIFIGIASAAAVSCAFYAISMLAAQSLFHLSVGEGSGYICAMLFLIPGFPFITSVLDLAKLDMRSGVERLMYSVTVVAVATAFAWVFASLFNLAPEGTMSLTMDPWLHAALRFIACFIGIFCITMLFNSPYRIALAAAIVGAVANTLRLELIALTSIPVPIAAFIGAFTAGLLSALAVRITGFPRACVTIGALMISVPGVSMYQSVYYLGSGNVTLGIAPFVSAISVIFATALGVLFAKYITDRKFRYRD